MLIQVINIIIFYALAQSLGIINCVLYYSIIIGMLTWGKLKIFFFAV